MTFNRIVTAVVIVAAIAAMSACAQGNLPGPVQAAVADLAERLAIEQAAVTVAGFEEVTWPDTSLGVPEEGRMYAQVVTPGYRVRLRVQEQRYTYHTDMAGRVVLAEGSAPAAQLPGQDEPEDPMISRILLIDRGIRHLSEQLDVDRDRIYLASVEERNWPDAALGAPLAGQTYAQVETPGYRLIFEVDGNLYRYHTDLASRIVSEEGGAPEAPPAAGEGVPTQVVEQAIADLASRLNIDRGDVEVVLSEQVEWPSGSLGLPEPGMMYTMAIITGQRVVLEAEGRQFEYRTGQSMLRYAGVVYGEQASLLALYRAEPRDGNNFFHLQSIDIGTHAARIVTEFISDFAATPDGLDIAVKSRTSRSGHELAHINAAGERTPFASAFDFSPVAWRPDGAMLAYWAQESVGDRTSRLRINRRPFASQQLQPALPGLEPGSYEPGRLVWTNDGLGITVITGDGPRSFYWNGEAVQELGSYGLMGWIPRTSSLLATRDAGDGTGELVTITPGRGDGVTLMRAANFVSAVAPGEGQYVVVATRAGDQIEVQRVGWGGNVFPLRSESAQSAALSLTPPGQMIAISTPAEDGWQTEVVTMDETPRILLSTHMPAPPVLVMR